MPTDNTNSQTDPQPNTQGTPGETPTATWESILSELPEEAKGLYEQHTHGLKSALDTERQQRQDLAGQLRDASAQLEAGSEAKKKLDELQVELENAQRRADFATEAGSNGVTNVRLAYLAAQEFDTFDRRGNVQWDALKAAAPELFTAPAPARGNAGAGTQAPGRPAPDIDDLIRAAAGR